MLPFWPCYDQCDTIHPSIYEGVYFHLGNII